MREPPAITCLRRKYRVVAPAVGGGGGSRDRVWRREPGRTRDRIARTTIHAGLRDLQASRRQRTRADERIQCVGAGRRRLTASDPALLAALSALIEPTTRCDPESPLRWTCKSTAQLADAVTAQRHPVSPRTVAALLRGVGYSLQANRKTREGISHPDRDAQFRYLAALVTAYHQHQQPVISVDTKKKELVGDFKNGGREWRPQGRPVPGPRP